MNEKIQATYNGCSYSVMEINVRECVCVVMIADHFDISNFKSFVNMT
jgi:hypothetical protein